jgi:flagellar basal-body rod protein FlgB
MTGMGGSSFRIDLLARVLDASALRHRVLAHNVANVNTPNYARLDVAFEDDLGRALARGQTGAGVRPHVTTTAGDATRADGNTVDIDREMAQLTQNNLLFAAAAQVLASRLGTLRSAITGR